MPLPSRTVVARRFGRINGRLRFGGGDAQGLSWYTSSDTLKDDWSAYDTEGADCEGNSVEITATAVKSPAISVSCVVRKVTKFDVCPWG